jgi:hypothetical protein
LQASPQAAAEEIAAAHLAGLETAAFSIWPHLMRFLWKIGSSLEALAELITRFRD